MTAFKPKLTPEARREIGLTRLTSPRMRWSEIQALAQKHGISPEYVCNLRTWFAEENEVPVLTGRPPIFDDNRLRELEPLVGVLSTHALSARFNASPETVRKAVRRIRETQEAAA